MIDLEKPSSEGSFDAMRNTVHTLISSSADLANLSEKFLASDSDRFIQIFDIQSRKLVSSLVADAEVELLSLSHNSSQRPQTSSRSTVLQQQVLAAVTRNGSIELFASPFHQQIQESQPTAKPSLKSLRKSQTRRATAVIKLVRPDKSRSPVPVVAACFDGPDLVVAWVEAGVNLSFHRIRWQKEDSEELALEGEVEIVKARSAPLIGSATTNGVKDIGKTHVDETHAVVEQGGIAEGIVPSGGGPTDAISIEGSDEEDEEEDEEEADEEMRTEEHDKIESARPASRQVGKKPEEEDIEMADASAAEDDEQGGEPSFGELLRANHAAEPIDVEAALQETDADALVLSQKQDATSTPRASLPSGISLATVLSQALKTNDNSLLESCFHTPDVNIVRATIQRIDSSLAATLLHRLAERLSARPGRYGHLLVWVQWTCVAHGGALAGRPETLQQITSLFKVMDQRSACLPSLLMLKGKLDMLDAQLSLRQSLQEDRAVESEDEERVIYVEGQEDVIESDDEGVQAAITAPGTTKKHRDILGESEDDDDEEAIPLTVNGIAGDSEEEEEDDEEEEEDENLLDDEAELSLDEGEEVSSDESEEEGDGAEEEDEEMEDFIADTDEESVMSVAAVPVAKSKSKTKKARKA
jgi:U3 small nucleolar RNA-associated protein 5